MKKTVIGRDVYFTLAWSPPYHYDRYEALRVLPELAGIICLMYQSQSRSDPIFFYSCHRDGCRVGFKRLMDAEGSRYPGIISEIDLSRLYYKYTLVDNASIADIQDILYWLIRTYHPRFNESTYQDSKRYDNIYLNEITRSAEDVVEKIRGHRGG